MDEWSGDGGSVTPPGVLAPDERRRVVLAGVVPVAVVAVVLVVLVGAGRLSLVDLVVGTVLYGGLLGLTVGVVAHERAVADHCPRCGARGARGAASCGACGYDLARRPVWACELGHERAREPGLCSCGRRLQEREPAPGLGRSIRRSLWVGVWLFALLVGTAVLLQVAA